MAEKHLLRDIFGRQVCTGDWVIRKGLTQYYGQVTKITKRGIHIQLYVKGRLLKKNPNYNYRWNSSYDPNRPVDHNMYLVDPETRVWVFEDVKYFRKEGEPKRFATWFSETAYENWGHVENSIIKLDGPLSNNKVATQEELNSIPEL